MHFHFFLHDHFPTFVYSLELHLLGFVLGVRTAFLVSVKSVVISGISQIFNTGKGYTVYKYCPCKPKKGCFCYVGNEKHKTHQWQFCSPFLLKKMIKSCNLPALVLGRPWILESVPASMLQPVLCIKFRNTMQYSTKIFVNWYIICLFWKFKSAQ